MAAKKRGHTLVSSIQSKNFMIAENTLVIFDPYDLLYTNPPPLYTSVHSQIIIGAPLVSLVSIRFFQRRFTPPFSVKMKPNEGDGAFMLSRVNFSALLTLQPTCRKSRKKSSQLLNLWLSTTLHISVGFQWLN